MNDLNKRPEGITEYGSTNHRPSSATLACPAQSKRHQLKLKSDCYSKNIRTDTSLAIQVPASILSDEALEPYWNEHCAANQSTWWLPHRIASRGQGFRLSDTSLNYQVDQSSFWKKTISPINSTSDTSLRISLPSAIPFTESVRVKGTRKIRVFPKNEPFLLELVRQQRRAYNLAIACFKEADAHPELRTSDDLRKTNLRKIIREFVQAEVDERGGVFMSSGCDEAADSASLTRDAVIRGRKRGERTDYSFKSIKDIRQSFIIQKLSAGFVAKNFDISEAIPQESFGRVTRVTFERGRWFICAQKHIVTVGSSEIQARSIVAIDPGVRTFATAYSMNQSTIYGGDFYSTKVFPLLQKVDQLIGCRAKAKNDQWKRHYTKRIDKLVNRAKDLTHDLHKRVACDLVANFDVILLPTFETSEMSAKTDRKIRTKTVRSMLGLAHYKFQQHLAWMCKKLGKTLILVNEAYTSKTQSWSGVVNQKLGGSKTISDENIRVDRDVNGARGIMLRALYGNLAQKQATA